MFSVPFAVRVPLHAPDAVQEVVLVDDQVIFAVCPNTMLAESTPIVTVGIAVAVSITVWFAVPPSPLQVSVYASVPVAVGVKLSMPLVAFVPLHAPDAIHDVALVEDQVILAV